jgi:hypothetical protein
MNIATVSAALLPKSLLKPAGTMGQASRASRTPLPRRFQQEIAESDGHRPADHQFRIEHVAENRDAVAEHLPRAGDERARLRITRQCGPAHVVCRPSRLGDQPGAACPSLE